MYTENLFEDPTTAEVESTTPADNLNIQGNGDTMIAILKTSFRKTKWKNADKILSQNNKIHWLSYHK